MCVLSFISYFNSASLDHEKSLCLACVIQSSRGPEEDLSGTFKDCDR